MNNQQDVTDDLVGGVSETGTEEFKEFLFVGISVRKSEKINRSIVFQ